MVNGLISNWGDILVAEPSEREKDRQSRWGRWLRPMIRVGLEYWSHITLSETFQNSRSLTPWPSLAHLPFAAGFRIGSLAVAWQLPSQEDALACFLREAGALSSPSHPAGPSQVQ